jgi:cysteinyl-tRNA synthetase
MKRFKHFTIDEEIAEELEKEKNASKIVNNLLKDYYNSNSNLKKQELKNKLIQIKEEREKLTNEMEVIEKQIISIEKEENRINETYKNIPKDIMEDFNFFNKMTKESLFIRYKNIYSKRFKDLDWNELKKAFCEFKEIKEDAE